MTLIGLAQAKTELNKSKKIYQEYILSKGNLIISKVKTEGYEISRDRNDDWKKCKVLGSLIDTISDINRRKALTFFFLYFFYSYNKRLIILYEKGVKTNFKKKLT